MTIQQHLILSVICAKLFPSSNVISSTKALQSIHQFSDPETSAVYMNMIYTEQDMYLLCLFAMEIIDEEYLGMCIGNDIYKDIIEKCIYLSLGDVDGRTLGDMFKLCVNSIVSGFMEDIDLNEALEFFTTHEHNEITITEGYIHVADELYCFLQNIGAEFAVYSKTQEDNDDEPEVTLSLTHDKDNNLFSDTETTVICDVPLLFRIYSLYKKPFADSFVLYCKENSVNISEDEYKAYIRNKKLKFNIKILKYLHKVCGDKINHYDYEARAIVDSMNDIVNIENTELLDTEIVLDEISSDMSDEELVNTAVTKVIEDNTDKIEKMCLFIITHMGKNYYCRINQAGGREFTSEEEYRKDLFNFIRIWKDLQVAEAEGALKVINNRINIQMDVYFSDCTENELIYASRIISEQIQKAKIEKKQRESVQIRQSVRSIFEQAERMKDELNTPSAKEGAGFDPAKRQQNTKPKTTNN